MKPLLALILCIFAFLVALKGGHGELVMGAVGFTIMDREYGSGDSKVVEPVMVFCDQAGHGVKVVPLGMLDWAVYLPDDKLI